MENTEPCGILIVNKHSGCTSLDIVNMVRRLYNTRRVGHTGTLDPMATGVLVVLVGRAAKAAEFIPSDRKSYKALLRLGVTTDTEDSSGNILSESDNIPDKETVLSVCKEFNGEIEQIPPMYSAIKIGGRKLVDIARKGGEIERTARKITVFSLNAESTELSDEYTLNVDCSGGTYIRTLCSDIGKKLGCGGVMASLVRTAACGFSIDTAKSIDELRKMSQDELCNLLMPVGELFTGLSTVTLPPFYEKLFRSGCEIYQKKINTTFNDGDTVSVYGENCGFFALGKVVEYPDGSAIKSVKLFSL